MDFKSLIYKFIWAGVQRDISLEACFFPRECGGLGLIDFQLKMNAFRIALIHKVVLLKDKPWCHLWRLWTSFTLRRYNGDLWDNSRPNNLADMPYETNHALNEYMTFRGNHPDLNLDNLSCASIYKKLFLKKYKDSEAIVTYPSLDEAASNELWLNNYAPETPLTLRNFLFLVNHERLLID